MGITIGSKNFSVDIGDYLDSFFPYDNYYNHCKECWKIKIKNNDTKMKWQ